MTFSFLTAAFLLPQVINGDSVKHPADRGEKTYALYYTTDWGTCHDWQTTKLPDGLTDSGNAFMLSFISCGSQDCTDETTPDGWYEDTNGLGAACELIKAENKGAYVAYSVGGAKGSKSQFMRDYFTTTPAQDIADRILAWDCADGVDWDFEGDFLTLPNFKENLVAVSKLVKAGGKSITFASYGSIDDDDRNAPIKALLKEDPLVSMWGIMMYPGVPGQGGQGSIDGCGVQDGKKCTLETADPNSVVGFVRSSWQSSVPAIPLSRIAGGKLGAQPDKNNAVKISQNYRDVGLGGIIVWVVNGLALVEAPASWEQSEPAQGCVYDDGRVPDNQEQLPWFQAGKETLLGSAATPTPPDVNEVDGPATTQPKTHDNATMDPEKKSQKSVEFWTVKEVLAKYTHVNRPFTQGLVYLENDLLLETSGLYNKSFVQIYNYKTGEVKKKVDLDAKYFAEGIAKVNDEFHMLTWQEKTVLVFDSDLNFLRDYPFDSDGWGMINYAGNKSERKESEALFLISNSSAFANVFPKGRGQDMTELE